ncbi:TerB N-terminal domain-containing protein [Brevibacillus sp. SIMBA_040]|uniref:TerB N-terminal domain-containing protein n=3 Tax=Bacteria TaxID=2 RepID=UPI0039798CF8
MNGQKSTTVACLLAIFLGGFGAHLFYVGKYKRAVLYLVFFWTYIPVFLGWIDLFFIPKWMRQWEVKQPTPYQAFTKRETKKLVVSQGEQSRRYESPQITPEKKTALYYKETSVILEKYAHLKTPGHVLAGIESVLHPNKKQYESDYGITITVSYSRDSDDFLKDSIRFAQEGGKQSPFQPLQMYWTTFDKLDAKQKGWYFYWRSQALNGNYLETDLSYLILFTYELINYSFNQNAAFNVSMMVRLYEEYKDRMPGCKTYLSDWIHDFLLELDEVGLASEWGFQSTMRSHTLFDKIKEKEDNLESISITLWKPFITGYRETEFFRPNKNKIYKVFKESVPLLQRLLQNDGVSVSNKWFEQIKGTQRLYLYRSAVIGRNIEGREKKIETVERQFNSEKILH